MELRPNVDRSKMAILLVMIVMILNIITLFSNVLEYQLLTSDSIDLQSAESNDTRQQILGILFLIAYIISVIMFIQWFRRAYFNLHCKFNNLKYPENSASYCWFIPIISLYKPYHIAKELFEKTHEYLKKNKINYNGQLDLNIVGIWWTFWIISNIFGNISFRLSLNAETIEQLTTVSQFSIVDDIISIPLALVTIKFIKEYSKIETLFFETEVQYDEIEVEQIEII